MCTLLRPVSYSGYVVGGETGNGGRDRPSPSPVQPSTASGSHTTTDKDES